MTYKPTRSLHGGCSVEWRTHVFPVRSAPTMQRAGASNNSNSSGRQQQELRAAGNGDALQALQFCSCSTKTLRPSHKPKHMWHLKRWWRHNHDGDVCKQPCRSS